MKTLTELVRKLRSRAWEDRQHRQLREEAADRLEAIERAWAPIWREVMRSPLEPSDLEDLRRAIETEGKD